MYHHPPAAVTAVTTAAATTALASRRTSHAAYANVSPTSLILADEVLSGATVATTAEAGEFGDHIRASRGAHGDMFVTWWETQLSPTWRDIFPLTRVGRVVAATDQLGQIETAVGAWWLNDLSDLQRTRVDPDLIRQIFRHLTSGRMPTVLPTIAEMPREAEALMERITAALQLDTIDAGTDPDVRALALSLAPIDEINRHRDRVDALSADLMPRHWVLLLKSNMLPFWREQRRNR